MTSETEIFAQVHAAPNGPRYDLAPPSDGLKDVVATVTPSGASEAADPGCGPSVEHLAVAREIATTPYGGGLAAASPMLGDDW